ncbi:DUF4097 family beta strand repeat-containing protein [Cohnella pontilimi]|nr:DUF4097 family beta strand repeat-containing protein [Cohnella pontilimi]
MIRVGRYTAALSMMALGVVLLLGHWGAVDAMAILRVWWPVIVVVFGVELLIVQGFFRKEGSRVRPAFGALFGAAVLSGFIIVATQGSESRLSWLSQWTDGVTWSLYDSDHAKYSFDKEMTVVPPLPSDGVLTITNVNGRVILQKGPVRNIEVRTSVHVNVSDRANAEDISGKSYVEIKGGRQTEVIAHTQPYGIGKMRKPGMDMTVIFPEDGMPSSVNVKVVNGEIRVEQLPDSRELVLDLKNGEIGGQRIGGTLRAKVINGDVKLAQLSGDATVETVNGDIVLQDANKAVWAKTVNGDVVVRSPVVGGNWTIASTVGDISLSWPETAGVNVKATTGYGRIRSDWTLSHEERSAQGKLGNGAWTIRADTQADVSLKRLQP